MNIEELLNKLEQVEQEKQNILNENDKLKQLLQNYNDSRKNYYEKNKEIVKENPALKKVYHVNCILMN